MITTSICIIFFGNKNISAYGQILFMLSTFPVFAILFKISFNKFSDGIESKRPELFRKNNMTYGDVSRLNIFNISEFENLDDIELIESLKLVKQLFKLTIISFALIIILGISSTLI